MKLIKDFLHTLLTIIVLTVLPLAVFTLITSKTNLIAGIQSFVVLTGSMEPGIPVGSIIYTIPLKSYSFEDVVAFKSGEITVTHRIADISFENHTVYYQTKGDANNSLDQNKITNNDILGKTFLSIPYLGKVSMWMKTPLGFVISILLPLFGFIVFEFWSLIKEIEKEAERKLIKKMHAA